MTDQLIEILSKDKEKLIELLDSKELLASDKTFGRRIFLIEALVAGTTHLKEDPQALEAELTKGERLNFFREPENPHDNLAISVKNALGKKIGYVPRKNNEILARLMDAGKLVYGTVVDKRILNNWLRVAMEIYLDD
jgi:hypothetical protein